MNVPAASDKSKNPVSGLHVLNLVVAICAGLISVIGGVYSIKMNIFSPKTATLQGVVMDANIAKPLWLAPIEISKPDGALIANVNTDQTGHYSVPGLKAGEYLLKISAPMHEAQTRHIQVDPSVSAPVNFELVPVKPKDEATPPAAPFVQERMPPPPPAYVPPPQVPVSNRNPYGNQSAEDYSASDMQQQNYSRGNYSRRRMQNTQADYQESSNDAYGQDPYVQEAPDQGAQAQPASMSGVLAQLAESWVSSKMTKKNSTQN